MLSVGGDASGQLPNIDGADAAKLAGYERMLLEAIGFHCGTLRHTGRLVACLTCEALAITVKLLNPVDMVNYERAAAAGNLDLGRKGASDVDNRHSATYVPVGNGRSTWSLKVKIDTCDLITDEIAVVMTKYCPLRRKDLSESSNDDGTPLLDSDLDPNTLTHFAALVDVGWKGLPFPLDVAAPHLDRPLVSNLFC